MRLAAAEKVLWLIICRLSGNNRPITDYLKNGRLIGFADYLPINRLISTLIMHHHERYQIKPLSFNKNKITKIGCMEY